MEITERDIFNFVFFNNSVSSEKSKFILKQKNFLLELDFIKL